MSRVSSLLYWLAISAVIGLIVLMAFWVTPIKTVASGSMEPTLPTGSRILIHQQDSYQVGDIITFYADESEVVTHRLIDTTDDGSFITKGDANPTPDVWDEPVTTGDVLGKVIYMTPITTAEFWHSKFGIVLGISLIVLLAAMMWPEDESSTNQSEGKPSTSSV